MLVPIYVPKCSFAFCLAEQTHNGLLGQQDGKTWISG